MDAGSSAPSIELRANAVLYYYITGKWICATIIVKNLKPFSQKPPKQILLVIYQWRAARESIRHPVKIYRQCHYADCPQPAHGTLLISAAHIPVPEKPKNPCNPKRRCWIEIQPSSDTPCQYVKHSPCHAAACTGKSSNNQKRTKRTKQFSDYHIP